MEDIVVFLDLSVNEPYLFPAVENSQLKMIFF